MLVKRAREISRVRRYQFMNSLLKLSGILHDVLSYTR